MTNEDPMRPDQCETVLFEPDEQRTLAVLPGILWLSSGDIVELDDPPRDARVLSTRLQLRDGRARVLVVLDVPDSGDADLRGASPTEVVLGSDLDAPDPGLGAEIDRDLAALEPDLEATPDDVSRTS